MGDIPDWLIELARNQAEGQEDAGEETGAPPVAPEEPPLAQPAEAPVADAAVAEAAAAGEEPNDFDVMESLRSEVEDPGIQEIVEPEPFAVDLDLGLGLQAWQRFVLALFLFLDVAIIGMMFLVMLGRMQIL